jgi:indolepyruvate ferredoxin oxidoreductase, beta subunit
MKYDIVLSGVGGQGVLTVAAVISSCAMDNGLFVEQAEVHGMAQRGGAVMASVRISDSTIHSKQISKGTADLLLSLEPLESLRYLDYINPKSSLVTDKNPKKNIPDYPPLDELLDKIRSIPNAIIVDADKIAKDLGSSKAANIVLVGACAADLPVSIKSIENTIKNFFAGKGDEIIELNIKAFRAGLEAAK